MIRVGLARTTASYAGLAPPFDPGAAYPELEPLFGPGPRHEVPNPVYAGVRAALRGLGLDLQRYGTREWNPLGSLVARGGHVVLKPNFIRHWNPQEDQGVECVITHGSVLRAATDYALLAVGPEGAVTIAEAPQMDCDWDRIREIAGLDALAARCAETSRELRIVDLRREAVRFEDGIVVSRRSLPGDPAGYRVVDLGSTSFFHGSGLEPGLMRGADYDPEPTALHHRDGHNRYLLSETVLSADLVVNLPKIKTHKKTGVTLSQKNLVGINGDKNWLPHHCVGSPSRGGDEFPNDRLVDRLRSRATEWARPLLDAGRGVRLFQLVRRAERATRGDDFIRAGNWYGNRTTWRMCLDLNRCFAYSDAKGLHLDASAPVRKALHLLDGIVAGEDNGPLAPVARPLGAVIAATDPVAADIVAVRLMGFDEQRLPILKEAMRERHVPVTSVTSPDEVEIGKVEASPRDGTGEIEIVGPDDITAKTPFVAHPGWRGRIERTTP